MLPTFLKSFLHLVDRQSEKQWKPIFALLKTKLVALDVKCLCTSTIQTLDMASRQKIWHLLFENVFLKSTTATPASTILVTIPTLPLNGFGILPTQFASVNLTLHHYSVSLLMTVTTTTGNLEVILVEAGFRFDRGTFHRSILSVESKQATSTPQVELS